MKVLYACYQNDNLTSIREERNKKKEKEAGWGRSKKRKEMYPSAWMLMVPFYAK